MTSETEVEVREDEYTVGQVFARSGDHVDKVQKNSGVFAMNSELYKMGARIRFVCGS